MPDTFSSLAWAFKRLARAQGHKLDNLRLNASLQALPGAGTPQQALAALASRMGLNAPRFLKNPDAAHLPLLAHTDGSGWVVLTEQTVQGGWRALGEQGSEVLPAAAIEGRCAVLETRGLSVAFGASALLGGAGRTGGFLGHVYSTLRLYKGDLLEACAASAFIGFLALATSLFSMQVYDRVIPTRSSDTLAILASGVALCVLIELFMKFARSKLMDHVTVGLDNRLSREIFSRLLQLRVDQVPASVGSLAGQVRGFEVVRGFYTASTLFTLIDLPLGLVFIALIVLIGHPLVAAVPLVAFFLALAMGLSMRSRLMRHAMDGAQHSNLKTGLLVEAVEGMETIKAGAGGWKFLSRWIDVNHRTIANDLQTRRLTEGVSYLSAALQQLSYAGLVVAGAWAVMQGHMTMGALIACSIMSGRVLAPVMALPGLLVQHAHARAALESLEKLHQLPLDNHAVEQPLVPDQLAGHYQLSEVRFAYGDGPPALQVDRLEIRPGERVAVLGPNGAGKSTLLRLLSGMYHPSAGRVLVDGLDLSHVHRQVVSEHVGYLQQEHRLFQGTVRENLLVGLPDPGDDVVLHAMQRTGMDKQVALHPKGLERVISEGGKGLSGGQKQLLAFTRIVLTSPAVLLLDEPTATLDDEQERRCLRVLAEEAARGKTVVVVTHKPSVLPLVERIVVVAGNRIVMDGPRDAVLQQLQQRAQPAATEAPATAAPRGVTA